MAYFISVDLVTGKIYLVVHSTVSVLLVQGRIEVPKYDSCQPEPTEGAHDFIIWCPETLYSTAGLILHVF